MEKKTIFGVLSALFLIAILFTPSDSNVWVYFAILGIIFGIGWMITNKQFSLTLSHRNPFKLIYTLHLQGARLCSSWVSFLEKKKLQWQKKLIYLRHTKNKNACVAQWQSTCFVSKGSGVQIPPQAYTVENNPEFELHKKENQSGVSFEILFRTTESKATHESLQRLLKEQGKTPSPGIEPGCP